jgi:Domain of unknown function (DUF4340)
MNRKTLTALGLFVVLGALALVALRQPEKGERAADHPHPVPKLSPVEITSLEVTRGGSTTTIKNEGGKYRIAAPVAYAADEPAAKAAFEGLGKMDISDLVTEQKTKQAEFEVDDKSGIRVVAKHDDRVLADLIVGKSVGAGTMVRPSGTDETWRASGITRYVFDKSAADWRDKSIVTFPMADAARLEVAAKDGSKIALQKAGAADEGKGTDGKGPDGKDQKKPPGGDDKWAVTQSSVKIDKLDEAVPNGIASAMASWKANDFADGVSLADAGLAPPELTVTLGAKGGPADKSVTILIGRKKGDDEVYVKKADAPQIFLVKQYNLERIDKRPMEFRDKTLCDVASADLTEIAVSAGDRSYTLVRSGSDWKAAKPAKLEIDSSKVTPIAGGFKDWKGNGFAEDQSLKSNGLAKPKAVISVKAASKGKGKGMSSAPACQIRVGDETKDKINYYVASAKSADVYTAPKWAIDRILVKPDELKSAANPGAAQTDKKPGASKPVKPVLAARPAKK